MPDDQLETLKAEVEAHYSGAANVGRPLLLEGASFATPEGKRAIAGLGK